MSDSPSLYRTPAQAMADCSRAEEELARREYLEGDPERAVRLQWPGVQFDWFQYDIIKQVADPAVREIFIKGCTKAGKGAGTAAAINLHFWAHRPSKTIITSQRFEHARTVMFAEVTTWRRRMAHPHVCRALTDRFETDDPLHYVMIANPDSGEGFSGQHGPATLFVFDEATAIPETFYGMAQTQSYKIVAIANPRTVSGWFRKAFGKTSPNKTQTISAPMGLRRLITISGAGCANVIHNREIIPNQIDRTRFEGIMANPDSRWARVFGLGEFPEADPEKQIMLPEWLEHHQTGLREVTGRRAAGFGLDVADSEYGDESVLTAGDQNGIIHQHPRQGKGTMALVGWVLSLARETYGVDLTDHGAPIAVDCDGLGVGVADRLEELGCWVIRVNGNAKADNDKQYVNLRAELYGEMGRRLNPEGPWAGSIWTLPVDQKLADDLLAPEKIYGSDGLKYKITPKDRTGNENFKGDTIRDKLQGRSPDRGDSAVYFYHAMRKAALALPPVLKREILAWPQPQDRPPRTPAEAAERKADRKLVRDLTKQLVDDLGLDVGRGGRFDGGFDDGFDD